jgi:hypothetical protein
MGMFAFNRARALASEQQATPPVPLPVEIEELPAPVTKRVTARKKAAPVVQEEPVVASEPVAETTTEAPVGAAVDEPLAE